MMLDVPQIQYMQTYQEKQQNYLNLLDQAIQASEEVKEQYRKIAWEEYLSSEMNNAGFSHSKQVTCYITYYFAEDSKLQGGYIDKRGIELHLHKEPIVALPKDVPYGSYIVFDTDIRGNTTYKNVDTGGAIAWMDSNTCKVDVFVPEAQDYSWLVRNTNNTVTTATIYYKKEEK